jgi:TonB-linked SusC/RagA family outer membrane protein
MVKVILLILKIKHMIFKYKTILSFLLFVFMIEMAYAQSEKKDSLDNKNENIQTYGYNYSLPEWMVTNSVSSISSSNINNSFTTNFGNKLHGQIPGLTVSQTRNEPGLDTPNLYSRGIGTFGAKDMLIIIDGFESFYEQLISEEVESVTLLKDAAATSMYGMRGANGVLIISTKRGQQGPLKVEFSAQTGFESPYRLPNFLDSYDYARLYNEALVNDGLPMAYSEDEIDAYRSGGDPYIYPNVDWQEKLLRNSAPVSKYNLTFSGGKNKVNYFVLLSAMNRSGLYEKTEDLSEYSINSKFTQYNIRTNVDIDITDRLIASLNLGFTIEDKKNPGGYSTNSIFNLMSSIPPNAFPIYNPNGTYGGNSKFTNPWGDILESGFFTSNYRTSQSSLKLKHELDMIAEGLSITAAASFNNAFRGYSSKSRDYERYSISRDTLNNYSYRKFGEITSLSASENQFDQWRNMAFQAFLNYEKSFNGNFIDATLGYDMNSYTLQWEKTDFRHLGLNGRISYAHQKKYIGELSLGYYGANGFPKEKRFGFFPAASLGWILSNEDFLQKNNVLTYLKFRTSYGISGNNLIGNQRFMYDQYYSHQGSYIYGTTSVGGYAEAHLANPDLTWEKKREINVGFDMNLLNNINVNFDVFKQFRYDILAEPQSQIPAYTGILLPQWNVGKVENKGFEAQVGYKSSRSGVCEK